MRITGSDIACGTHATAHDRALADAHRRGYNEGYKSGSESGTHWSTFKVEQLEKRVKDLEAQLDQARRYYEIEGDQVVEVGRYAYRWRGPEALEVGDRVLLPENYVTRLKNGPGATLGTVTALGATYRGTLSVIVGRAPANLTTP
ncbi:hypothetical protein GTZ85_04220 [Streptomyces sp. SID5474]|nr:hypothetical protein [Streptomyces sp. SID5474]